MSATKKKNPRPFYYSVRLFTGNLDEADILRILEILNRKNVLGGGTRGEIRDNLLYLSYIPADSEKSFAVAEVKKETGFDIDIVGM